MEDWPADALAPDQLSQSRTDGCDYCVVIVGFTMGSRAENDPARRSIVQLEVEHAQRSGAEILVFLKEEDEEFRHHLNDPDSSEVRRWRQELERTYTCSYFRPGQGQPLVLPSLMRSVDRKHRQARSVNRRLTLLGLGAPILILSTLALLSPVRASTMNALAALHDPVAFRGAGLSDYKLARLIDGRSDLVNNTDFRKEISETQENLDIFAVQFFTFQDFENEFKDILERGAKIRIVLADYRPGNDEHLRHFSKAKQDLKHMVSTLVNEHQIGRMQELANSYPNLFQVRLSPLPIFYNSWIRDSNSPHALAHLGVHYYEPVTNWPAFRFSSKLGSRQLQVLKDQFEYIWSMSVETPR